MMEFDLKRIVPRFLLEDRNGYAMAKAIEAGLKDFLAIAKAGLDTLNDADKMPEWRLDELAWEYNIPYDYDADADVKREWIRDVYDLSRLYGTPEGIKRFMAGYFDEAEVIEEEDIAFAFRVIFSGTWTTENFRWALKAIDKVKNVRSVLENLRYLQKWPQQLYAGCALYTYESGTYKLPLVVIENDWYIDEDSQMLLDEDGILLIVE